MMLCCARHGEHHVQRGQPAGPARVAVLCYSIVILMQTAYEQLIKQTPASSIHTMPNTRIAVLEHYNI